MQLRYGRKSGYAEAVFWENRHRKYHSDVRAVGGGSLDESSDRYPKQRAQFFAFLSRCNIELAGAKNIEFGSGNGFWARAVIDAGVASYAGYDISDTAVKNSRASVAGAAFHNRDLASPAPEMDGLNADLVFSIDVLQHVTQEPKAEAFLRNMARAARAGGFIVLTSYTGDGNRVHHDQSTDRDTLSRAFRPLEYVASWDIDFIGRCLDCCSFVRAEEFWEKHILAYKKLENPDDVSAGFCN